MYANIWVNIFQSGIVNSQRVKKTGDEKVWAFTYSDFLILKEKGSYFSRIKIKFYN